VQEGREMEDSSEDEVSGLLIDRGREMEDSSEDEVSGLQV
jgi:hypothetical protein